MPLEPPESLSQGRITSLQSGGSMRKRSLSRRRFLATAGAGGAALALGPASSERVLAEPTAQGGPATSPQFLAQLAEFASLPLPPDRAAQLAPFLVGVLTNVRAMQPAGYDDLEPATVFRVPVEG
jgi:hypothetical protein